MPGGERHPIIEFAGTDETFLALVLEFLTDKVQVMNTRGKRQTLPKARVLWTHAETANADEFPESARQLQTRIDELASQIDVELLWATALESGGEFTAAELSALFFSETTPVHQSAVWKALAADKVRFRRRDLEWQPRTEDQIEEIRLQDQRRAERVRVEALLEEWLKKLSGAPAGEDVPAEMNELLDALQSALLRHDDQALLRRLSAVSAPDRVRHAAYRVLLHAGRLGAEADQHLVMGGLCREFPAAVNAAAAAMVPFTAAEPEPAQFAIDDETTREVDDAVTILCTDPDRFRLAIDIADPARYIARDSAVDLEAARRSTTVYLPTGTVLMLPERIGCELASLTVGESRPAMRFEVELNGAGEIVDFAARRTVVSLQRRLTYEEVDAASAADSGALDADTLDSLRTLLQMAALREKYRIAAGAMVIESREYAVQVEGDDITVKVIDRESPARRAVAELMILANAAAAAFAQREDIPVIYRVQDAPPDPAPPPDASFSRQLEWRRSFGQTRLSIHPAAHAGIGVPVYLQLTSPLRRYADMVMQRQFASHLAGEAPAYAAEEILAVLGEVEEASKEAARIEREAARFWLLEYFRRHQSDAVHEAVVIEPMFKGYRVELTEWGCPARLTTARTFRPGEAVRVRFVSIVPDQGSLSVQEVRE